MAARGSGAGVYVTIAILGILCLVLFVLTLAFYGKVNSERATAEDAAAQRAKFVTNAEQDEAGAIEAQAQQARKSVFGFLSESMKALSTRVTGQPNSTLNEINNALRDIPGSDGSMLDLIRAQARQIEELNRANVELQESVTAKTAELAAAQKQYETERQGLQTAAGQVGTNISGYTDRVADHITLMDKENAAVTAQIADLTASHQNEVGRLNAQITDLSNQRLILEAQLATLRGERGGEALRGQSEYSLVDGSIVAVSAAEGSVTINRGRKDKIVIGMTFAVYADASSLRPDDSGNLPRGKAGIEVISVQDSSAVCRILRETRGNSVVRGDVIVNPVYDPSKKYRFVVYGNFDSDNDGVASIYERDGVVAQIRDWGGTVLDTEELAGDTDFLVLGERPVVPPEPPSSAPIETRQDWIKNVRRADLYDGLQRRAESTSIPVLNLNRLRTLLGN
ncbi:MAG: hypothetical protein IT439_12300 [Phycisphaerales bacterium]|nr:hypothetical protein [Phycisphaerales bacterium]